MSALQDIRFACRLMRRSPSSTSIALLSICISVAATAVVFAAVKSVLIDPLPYAHPDELVQLRSEFPKMQQQSNGDWVVWNDVQELGRRATSIGPLGVSANAIFDLAGDSRTPPEALYGVRVNAGLFPVLGVAPMLGRNILPEEDRPGHTDVIILSYGLWTRRFNSDRSMVGRTITVNGHNAEVIGVMPPGFNFPMRRSAAHTPSPYVEFWASPFIVAANPNAGLNAVARLRPGSSLQRARQEIASISSDLSREFPVTNRDRSLATNLLRERTLGTAAQRLWLLMAATALFMLIGCANVTNLLLARGIARQSEVAIRLSMGAPAFRIVRQLLTESCVLAILGGAAGYGLTVVAWNVLPSIAPISIPRLASARADTTVLAFALLVALANGLIFGIAPALRIGLGSHGIVPKRHDRIRSTLVAVEVAVSVLLVVIGGQVLASFAHLVTTDPGFQANRVLASVVLPAPERYRDPEKRALFYHQILNAVRTLPGVTNAGTVDALPFSGENHGGFVTAGGPSLTAEIDVAGGEYLQAIGVKLSEGRWFREDEMAPANHSAIVNTYLARQLWPGVSAIGQRVCVFCTPENPGNWKQVVGVVSSTSHSALDEPEKGNVYLAAGAMRTSAFLIIRTDRNLGEMALAIRRAIANLDPNQPVFLSASMSDLIGDSIADQRFVMILLVVTACLALLMAAAGVYGVISYITSRRTREIGIRIAIGATPRNVFTLIFQQGFRSVAIGIAAGWLAAILAARLLEGVLAGLSAGRNGAISIAIVLVAATAAFACAIPARRATRMEPHVALRQE
jgi:predicted permease